LLVARSITASALANSASTIINRLLAMPGSMISSRPSFLFHSRRSSRTALMSSSRGKPALQSVVAPPLVCDLHDCPHAPQGRAFARFRAFTNKHREQVRVVPVVFNQVIGGAAHCVSGER